MGEPIGNYTLKWQLKSLDLMDAKRKITRHYNGYQPDWPQPFEKATRSIEFYIDGSFYSDRIMTGIRFNTGVSSRAGEISYNVPGGSNWDKTFIHFPYKGCTSPDYLDAKSAKAFFKAGVRLSSIAEYCPDTGFTNLDALESAIYRMCEKPGADQKYDFCPKQKKADEQDKADAPTKSDDAKKDHKNDREAATPDNPNKPGSGLGTSILDGDSRSTAPNSVSSLLDDDAEAPAIKRRLAQEIEKYRPQAQQICQQKMQAVNTCFQKNNCNKPVDTPSDAECKKVPPKPMETIPILYLLTAVPNPGETCYVQDAECDAARRETRRRHQREEEEELAKMQQQWESRYRSSSDNCKILIPQRNAFSQCLTQYAASCNPGNFTSVDACVEDEIRRHGPTESDAKRLQHSEREQKAKTGSSGLKNILD